jgi:hypothetical protein
MVIILIRMERVVPQVGQRCITMFTAAPAEKLDLPVVVFAVTHHVFRLKGLVWGNLRLTLTAAQGLRASSSL